jgi:hypothetical protein
MKPKKVTVELKQSVAFDNHQLHVSGEGCHAVIQLTDAREFDKVKKGDTISISIETEKAPKAPKAKA